MNAFETVINIDIIRFGAHNKHIKDAEVAYV